MYELMEKTLREWNASNGERVKLQHGYIAAAVVTIVAAGLVGLVNYELGQRLTALALLALAVFFINLIAWTLFDGIVLRRITSDNEPVKGKSTTAVSATRKTTNSKSKKK